MTIQVLLFAEAKQVAGKPTVEIELPKSSTVDDVLDRIVDTVPELLPLKSSLLVAVNNQFASRDQTIQPADTVACFPPVSGG